MRTFFVGVHQPSDAHKLPPAVTDDEGRPAFEVGAFIARNRLKKRKSGFPVRKWVLDSSAFSTILQFGGYPDEPEVYAAEIKRWSTNGELLAAVTQDYMCEKEMLAITGMTVDEHQRLTIERYDRILACDLGGVYLMAVLQGYAPEDYVRHLRMYAGRIAEGAWVGVGSVCKRNGDPAAIEEVLLAIKAERPDLLLHGFGIKTTALGSGLVQELLETGDSMAWSYAARKQGRDGNDIREGIQFAQRIAERGANVTVQYRLPWRMAA